MLQADLVQLSIQVLITIQPDPQLQHAEELHCAAKVGVLTPTLAHLLAQSGHLHFALLADLLQLLSRKRLVPLPRLPQSVTPLKPSPICRLPSACPQRWRLDLFWALYQGVGHILALCLSGPVLLWYV